MTVVHLEGKLIRIQGTVQGVGFRPWVYRTAQMAGIQGRVRNDSAGVTIEAFGSDADLARFIAALEFPPPAARISTVDLSDLEAEAPPTFEIVASDAAAERRVSIPPDLATCPECEAEIFDPADRRYRYPFTNCTNCGPRFTISTDIPYDRPSTTMARFEMCPACRGEYEDVADRRFHAQPNACPVCGPQLTLRASDGARIHADDAIEVAAQAIRDGLIVAVKGLGGFHLACDATSDRAVRRLRARKRRDEKPFAVMVRTLDDAVALAVVDSEAARALTSPERPIVLLPKRVTIAIADAVAPRSRTVGVMLPYTPLHHLLLADAGRALVMTSGNLSDEPIAIGNDEALQRLGGIVDLFVLHDRDIASRADDSVVTMIAGCESVIRRSRGFVPRGIHVASGFSRPVLACGALLKNTFCIAAGTSAWLGPHIGDLEHVAAYDAYVAAIERLERFLRIAPEVIACDMHPEYQSSQYARQRPESTRIAVQHHHAHVVSAMAEHGLTGPAIGIAYDGAGYGTDGTIWGGEILIATPATFRRVATFRPLSLVGGDHAVREPWRIALALLDDAFDGDWPTELRQLFPEVTRESVFDVARSLLRRNLPFPRARGVGRYFDAFGALFLGRSHSSFEGQIALEWNQAADPTVRRHYAFALDTSQECCEIDLRPTVRHAVADRRAGVDVATIAAAFHNTVAEATAAVVRRAIAEVGALPILASGGCFQNARLAEEVRARLAPDHHVLFQRLVPPGDGGIALGQAVIADAIARGSEVLPCVWAFLGSSLSSTT
jgi:hydrogenase maturation protein HypF